MNAEIDTVIQRLRGLGAFANRYCIQPVVITQAKRSII